jgi:hypothetical protein
MQRLMGMEYRESQTSYFGKSGVPWLGSLVIRLKTAAEKESEKLERDASNRSGATMYGETQCKIEIFDATSDTGKENGFFCASTLEAILKLYKIQNPHITELILLSDGAGCFQGNHLLLYLPYIHSLTGDLITAHTHTNSYTNFICTNRHTHY